MMKTRTKMINATLSLALLAMSGSATAACSLPTGLFSLGVEVNGACQAVSAQTAENLFDKLTGVDLKAINTAYTNTAAATLAIGFNSLPITLTAAGNSTTVTLSIPAIGVNYTQTKATRDDSLSAIVDDIKKNNPNLLSDIMKYQAANSPASPITGAGGLIPSAVSSDFNSNFTDSATNIAAPASVASQATSNKSTSNLMGIALQYSSLTVGDSKSKVTTLPLSYTYRNDIDPRRQLTISLPITYIDTDGAKSGIIGLGMSYRFPMNDNWTLTPAFKISGVGSLDMATVAGLTTYSLTSTYIWALKDFDVAMGNMLSHSSTMKLQAGDYGVDPGISSTAFRNGVMLSQPVEMGGKRLSVEYSLIDTRYSGTKTFMTDSQEIGITIGTNKNAFSSRSFLRGGLSYMTAKNSHGITFNLGYWF
jgi:hypothetical protein